MLSAVGQAMARASTGLAALARAMAPPAAAHAPRGGASVTSVGDLERGLQALAELLRNADMSATDAIESLQQRHAGPHAARLAALGDAIATLDFEHALHLCDQHLEECSA